MSDKRRYTTRRWLALRWVMDHDLDVNSVLHRPVPSIRMLSKMLAEGQIAQVPVGFRLHKTVLTELGLHTLLSKHKHLRGHRSSGHALPARYTVQPLQRKRSPEPQGASDRVAAAQDR